MSNNKNFVVNNPVEVGGTINTSVGSTSTTAVTDSYALANFTYDNESFSIATEEANPTSVTFGDNGTKMYILGLTADSVFQYTLSTAWDISTASYSSNSFSVATQDANPSSVAFNDDGYKMYVMGFGTDAIYEYYLSTAWDVSTAYYNSVSFDTSTLDAVAWDLQFKPDGTKAYILGISAYTVYQCSLSTAWDLSTLSYDSVSFGSLTSQDTDPRGISFSSDGTKMYMIGRTTDTIYQYTLSTAWDISTASYSGISLSANQESDPYSIAINNDGSKMYVVGYTNDTVYQYNAGQFNRTTVDLSTGNYFADNLTNKTEFIFSNAPDAQNFQLELTGDMTFGFTDLVVLGTKDHNPQIYEYFGYQFSAMSEDGVFLYYNTTYYSQLRALTMSTPYDITSAGNASTIWNYSDTIYGFFISVSDQKVFTANITNSTIDRRNYGNFDTVEETLDVSTNFTNVADNLTFSSDGTEMYVTGRTLIGGVLQYIVGQYTLSTPWLLSTATYTGTYVTGVGTVKGLRISDDGTVLILENRKYVLSTPYDITTASLEKTFSIPNIVNNTRTSIATPTGEYLYAIQDGSGGGATVEGVIQFDITTQPEIVWPTSVDWQNGNTAQSIDLIQTNTYSFSTTDGGTTYFGRTSVKNIS